LGVFVASVPDPPDDHEQQDDAAINHFWESVISVTTHILGQDVRAGKLVLSPS
jgi:hypothetical protein